MIFAFKSGLFRNVYGKPFLCYYTVNYSFAIVSFPAFMKNVNEREFASNTGAKMGIVKPPDSS